MFGEQPGVEARSKESVSGGGQPIAGDPQPAGEKCHCCAAKVTPTRKFINGMRYGFISLPRDIGTSLLVGLVIAAFISAIVPEGFFAERLGRGLPAMLVMMALGIPMYVCASASVPIAAALILKGISPGAAFVFLVTGPATNAAGLATIWSTLGRRTAIIYLLTIASCALAGGLVLDSLISSVAIGHASHVHPMGPALIQHISAIVLLAVLGYAYLNHPEGFRFYASGVKQQ
jgi:hypothetical protein